MEVIYTNKCGRKRRGEYFNCEGCGQKHIRMLSATKKQKYCSVDCKNQSKRHLVVCSNCSKKFEIKKCRLNNKHGHYFCNRSCKDLAQRIGGNCPAIRPSHYGEATGTDYRKTVQEQLKVGCVGCGDVRKYVLVVHHIDGNKKNNNISNLEVVCGSCHMIRHMRCINNEWFYWAKALTPRELLSFLTDSKNEKCSAAKT